MGIKISLIAIPNSLAAISVSVTPDHWSLVCVTFIRYKRKIHWDLLVIPLTWGPIIVRNLGALTICMENPEIPGRIQMERFIPVEIFRKKSNTFRGITFFPFLPKRPKFSVPFVWITSAKLHVERKWKIYRYFVNGTTQSRSCFRCQKKYQYHLTEIFHQNFLANGKRSWTSWLPCANSDSHEEIEIDVTLLLGHRKYSGEGGGSVAEWSALRTRCPAVSDSSPALQCGHLLDLFSVVPRSIPWPHVEITNWLPPVGHLNS